MLLVSPSYPLPIYLWFIYIDMIIKIKYILIVSYCNSRYKRYNSRTFYKPVFTKFGILTLPCIYLLHELFLSTTFSTNVPTSIYNIRKNSLAYQNIQRLSLKNNLYTKQFYYLIIFQLILKHN